MIRYANRDDAAGIVRLLLSAYREVGTFGLNAEKVIDTVDKLLQDGLVIVAVKDNKVVGSFAAAFTSPWYSDEQIVVEQWIVVAPEHRRSRLARSMLKIADKMAKDMGMKLIVTVFTPVDQERKSKFMARIFEPRGGVFLGGA